METKQFDPKKDYLKELNDDELWGGEFPLLRGLQRLGHERGIKEIHSSIVAVPNKESPIAAVTVTVYFLDGTVFSGSADANFKAHDAPFNKHLTALADSKAEARAYRRAFNISKASKEECGEMPAEGDVDNVPVAPSQIEGIKNIAKLKGFTTAQALKLIGADCDVEELTRKQGREVIKALNSGRLKKRKLKEEAAKGA